jgi:uncharacterized phage protein (TIGR02216 family)
LRAAAGAAAPGEDRFWPAIQHLGLCLLRLPTETFWALTLGEILAMAGACRPRGAGLQRADLNALMAAFPDCPATGANG